MLDFCLTIYKIIISSNIIFKVKSSKSKIKISACRSGFKKHLHLVQELLFFIAIFFHYPTTLTLQNVKKCRFLLQTVTLLPVYTERPMSFSMACFMSWMARSISSILVSRPMLRRMVREAWKEHTPDDSKILCCSVCAWHAAPQLA